jgi:alpha-L-arabinofuranosidase
VQQATEPPAPPPQTIYASASRVDSTGQVIVKIANVSPEPQSMDLDLQGIGALKSADADVMTGEPLDQNSLADPLKVSPKEVEIPDAAPTFTHEFPAYSISVMRFNVN